MIRSLTDYLRDYKRDHADQELYNKLVPPKKRQHADFSRSEPNDPKTSERPKPRSRQRLTYYSSDEETPRKRRPSNRREMMTSDEEDDYAKRPRKSSLVSRALFFLYISTKLI